MALLYVALCIIGAQLPGFKNDVTAYQRWCLQIQAHGLSAVYGADSNYPPLIHYLLWLFAAIVPGKEFVQHYFYSFRFLILLFDFAGIYLIWRWAKPGLSFLQLLFYCLVLNIAFLYNTVIWGQTDSVGITLMFGALYAGWRNKVLLSTALCLLSINMKVHMFIFLPVWGIVVLYSIIAQRNWKLAGIIPVVIVAMEALILWPFINAGHGVVAILSARAHSVGELPYLSVHALNIWFLRFGIASRDLTDNQHVLLAMTYRQVGLALFFLTAVIGLIPLAKQLSVVHKRAAPIDKLLIWQTGALISLLFFFLNTEMHERYTHPALLFMAAIAFSTRRFGMLALFSLAYFWNLELYMQAFNWPPIVYRFVPYNDYLVALVFGGIIVHLFICVYSKRRAVCL